MNKTYGMFTFIIRLFYLRFCIYFAIYTKMKELIPFPLELNNNLHFPLFLSLSPSLFSLHLEEFFSSSVQRSFFQLVHAVSFHFWVNSKIEIGNDCLASFVKDVYRRIKSEMDLSNASHNIRMNECFQNIFG